MRYCRSCGDVFTTNGLLCEECRENMGFIERMDVICTATADPSAIFRPLPFIDCPTMREVCAPAERSQPQKTAESGTLILTEWDKSFLKAMRTSVA